MKTAEQKEAACRRAAKWRAKHLEEAKATSKRSYWKNRANKIVQMREYKRINRSKILAVAQKYRDTYPERVRASNQKWYREHKDDELERSYKWKKSNPEKVHASQKRYRERHPTTISKGKALWRRNNPLYAWSMNRRWRINNRHKLRHSKAARRARLHNLPSEDCSHKIKLLRSTVRFCHWCCSLLNQGDVTIDHVVSLNRGGHHINDNLVGCCFKCNCSKGDKPVHEWLPLIGIT